MTQDPHYPQSYQPQQSPYQHYAAQPYPYYPVQPAVAAKNPGLSLAASFFIPGLGSLINGSVGVGILLLGFWFVAWIAFLVFMPLGFVLGLVPWILGMYDGYTGARQWNAAHGIIS